MICSRAPGKIILFGEHFVVRGFPGIGVALNTYARACVESNEFNYVESKQLGVLFDEKSGVGLESNIHALINEIRRLGCEKKFRAFIDSSIFISSGMGSSAAVSVALTHAILRFCGLDPSKELVSKIAFEAEKVIHKRPSGIDNTLATYGGMIYYRSGEFKKIDLSWPENYAILVVNTGIERNTGVVVKDVLDLYERRRDILHHIYLAAEKLVEEALSKIRSGDIESLGELMNIAQGLLYTINVSCKKCEEIIWLLKGSGALGAKLSGAGRGGIVISLFRREDLPKIIPLLEREGLRYLIAQPDLHGVSQI